jgi:polyisoprenyl-teichoic acid--peptidoglycan teichoic acid transferase
VASSRDIWRSLSPASKAFAIGGIVLAVGAVAAVGALAFVSMPRVAESPPPIAEASTPPLPPTPSPDPSASPTPIATPTPLPPTADPLLGTDGRITVLLLGSDYRPAHPGNRTDAIMVVSLDPKTGKSAGFSIPRDVANFPLPTKGVYAGKVNALYAYLQRKGNPGALMKQAVSRAFGIEIDAYVFIGFTGVRQLVGAVGGVDIVLDKPYYDPYYWVNPRQRGWGLPAGKNHLNGMNALIFARSRKGDSDFGRARRQQMLVLAAVEKAKRRGIAIVPTLIAIARGTVRTDLPLPQAPALYNLFSKVNLAKVDRAVFGPKSFARKGPGTDYYLNLDACRAWIKAHFPPPTKPAATPAPATPAPSPTPTPAPTPSS